MKKKKMAKVIIIFVICIVAMLIPAIYVINRLDIEDTNKLNVKILYLMQNSTFVKEKIGNIEKVDKNNHEWFKKYDSNGSYWANYKITTDTGKEIHLKIILNQKETDGIYAYEIENEIFYEEIIHDENINLRYYVEK